MNEKTRKALEASIKHWEKNVSAKTPDDVKVNSKDCALCQLFIGLDGSKQWCTGCPVYNYTGEIEYNGTPYNIARDGLDDWKCDPDDIELKAAWHNAAQDELDFLILLRPE